MDIRIKPLSSWRVDELLGAVGNPDNVHDPSLRLYVGVLEESRSGLACGGEFAAVIGTDDGPMLLNLTWGQIEFRRIRSARWRMLNAEEVAEYRLALASSIRWSNVGNDRRCTRNLEDLLEGRMRHRSERG
jgi:hypothetical protein